MNSWFRRPADCSAMTGNLFVSFFFRLFQYWVLLRRAPHNKILKHLRSFLPLKSNCTSGQRFPYYSSIGRLSMVFEFDRQRAKTSRTWLRLLHAVQTSERISSTLKPNRSLSEVQTSGRLINHPFNY